MSLIEKEVNGEGRSVTRRPLQLWLLGLVVFAVGCALFSRDLHFSWHYHSDEGGKIEQIQQGARNFNHPLLMLHLTEGILAFGGDKNYPHDVVMAGRRAAVVAMALACAAFAVSVGIARGPLWGAVLGLLLLAHPATYSYARFFKEDPFLMAGLAVSLLGIALAGPKHRRSSWILLGLGLGITLGGKYIGVLWWPFLLAAYAASVPEPRPRWRGFLGALLLGSGVFLLIQLPGLLQPDAALGAISMEITKATDPGRVSDKGSASFPVYWKLISRPPYLLLGGVALAGLGLAVWRRKWVWFWCALPFWVYFLVIGFATKEAARYLLPWQVGICVSAVVVVSVLGEAVAGSRFLSGRRFQSLAGFVVATAFLAAILPELLDLRQRAVEEFLNQRHRLEFFDRLRQELPADAVIAYGARVGLVDPAYPEQYPANVPYLPQRVSFQAHPWDYRSAAGFRAAGFTHFVSSEEFDRMERTTKQEGKLTFFRDFRANTRVLFQSGRGAGKTQFPMRLTLHELPPPPGMRAKSRD